MARKFAIVAAVLIVVALVAGAIAFYIANDRYGVLTARAVNHDLIAKPDTRLRIAVDTIRLGEDLAPYLPENMPVPGWLPWDVPGLLPKVLPHEVAILGGSNYRENAFDLTVFINEQKGGPALPAYLNNQVRFKQRFPAVEWSDRGFHMEERGIVSIDGQLPLPGGLEDAIFEIWPFDPPEDTLKLRGGHTAEGVIDNRSGDLITIIGGLAPLWNTSLERLKAHQQLGAALTLLEQVDEIRLAVDFKNQDTLLLQLRAHTDQDTGGQLEFFIGMALVQIAQQVKAQYGLVLESEAAWKPEEEIYVCDISVIGVEEKFKAYFRQVLPSSPPPTDANAAE